MEIRLLNGREDAALLERVADNVFDRPVDPALAAEFLADDRHYLAAAIDQGMVVGFVSAVRYVHPDKPAELWINEVGVAPAHRGLGVGKALLGAMLAAARGAGCVEAWVLTEPDNPAAMALYSGLGGVENPSGPVMFSWPLGAPDAA